MPIIYWWCLCVCGCAVPWVQYFGHILSIFNPVIRNTVALTYWGLPPCLIQWLYQDDFLNSPISVFLLPDFIGWTVSVGDKSLPACWLFQAAYILIHHHLHLFPWLNSLIEPTVLICTKAYTDPVSGHPLLHLSFVLGYSPHTNRRDENKC